MMIRDGINIYPAEIEQALSQHDAVEDAAAFPLQHPVHQDLPVCAVALSGGNHGGVVKERALKQFASERLGERAPARIVILDRIPRNQQGKIRRDELRRRVQGLLEPPVEYGADEVRVGTTRHSVKVLSASAQSHLRELKVVDQHIQAIQSRLAIMLAARAEFARRLADALP